MSKIEERPWWPQLLELKDTLSLRELASRFSVSPATISNALKRGGLTREAAPPGPRATRSQEHQAAAAAALAQAGEAQPVQAEPAIEAAPPKAKGRKKRAPPTVQAEPAPAARSVVNPLADIVAALALEVTGLKAEVTSLKAEVSGLWTEAGNASGQIAALIGELGPIKAEVAGLKAEAQAMERADAAALDLGYNVNESDPVPAEAPEGEDHHAGV